MSIDGFRIPSMDGKRRELFIYSCKDTLPMGIPSMEEHRTSHGVTRLKKPRRRQHVPQDVVETVLRYSSLWASTRLQLVSRAWGEAGRGAMPCHQTPWVFLREHDGTTGSTVGYMVSIREEDAFFKLKRVPSELFPGWFLGSRDGWLAFVEIRTHRLLLLNPFTMSRVDVPQTLLKLYPTSIYLFSSDHPAQGCCMATWHEDMLAIWHPGWERWEQWTIRGLDRSAIRSVVAFKGRFYVLDRQGCVSIVDLSSSSTQTALLLDVPGVPPTSPGLLQLVESEGELLLVHCTATQLKAVHRLDLQTMECVKLQSLGKHRALFVTSSLFWASPISVSVERAVGCRGDCVYLLSPGCGARWTVFDMAGGDPETMESSPNSLPTEAMYRDAWVIPNIPPTC